MICSRSFARVHWDVKKTLQFGKFRVMFCSSISRWNNMMSSWSDQLAQGFHRHGLCFEASISSGGDDRITSSDPNIHNQVLAWKKIIESTTQWNNQKQTNIGGEQKKTKTSTNCSWPVLLSGWSNPSSCGLPQSPISVFVPHVSYLVCLPVVAIICFFNMLQFFSVVL